MSKLSRADFARYRDGIQMMKSAADRAGRRRLSTHDETHGVPVAVFL